MRDHLQVGAITRGLRFIRVLLHRVADSVRLFGDKAEQRHIQALEDLIAKSSGAVAEAAATVHGAMNLPTSGAVGLLPKPKGE